MTQQINKAWWNHSVDELEEAADSDGVVRNRTEKRSNRFSGQSIMLTKEEAIRHDRIFMNELGATLEDKELGQGGSKLWDKVRADLDWFRQHNAEAYMVLLD